ncbi:MAG TPA: DUF6508 domain-containing protein [Chloroflexia bacterium]|jgi:hypothetical protein
MRDYPPAPEITRESVERVLAFLPLFEAGDQGPLYTVTPPQEQDGVMYMLYITYSPEVERFIGALSSAGFVVPYDWVAWQDEAWGFVNDPDLLNDADLDTLRKLLTLHVRKDRFVEGHISEMIDLGHIRAILHRLKALYSQDIWNQAG